MKQKGPDHVWQNSLTGTNSPNEKYRKCMNKGKTNLDMEMETLNAVNVVIFRNLMREKYHQINGNRSIAVYCKGETTY